MNENKQMDNLSRKVIRKASLESPSFDFTTQIMAQLTVLKQSETTIYKPLISKKGWFVIFGGFAALVVYAIIGEQPQIPEWFDTVGFSTLLNNKILGIFSRLTFSKTLQYALFSLSIMVLIQVYLFKRYLYKRFEV
ncbi:MULTISPECIES: hypothetical protein [Flavobacterium]|uniref:Uncharacterized protein n=1 Tax=Flavobacterium ranwuense TaxID=2541725 RepID=A0ABY2DTP5_9FLAO|nr:MULTISPECIES: hypothetical protein [Flavobacterium]TDE30612.1 hypothetical protein E0I61_06380 [Flavobacterium ranwuense]TDE53255.1 hypothetical protein E0H99_08215 [Flavobacterium sp. GT3P67]